MGIRESVEQQPEGEMRLHEMVIEDKKEKPCVFDIEQEVSPEEWERIVNFTNDLWEKDDKFDFLWYVRTIKTIDPEVAKRFNLDDQVMTEAKKKTRDSRGNVSFGCLFDTEILFPDMIRKEQLIQDGEWKELIAKMKHERREGAWGNFSDNAIMLRLVLPEKVKEISLDDEAWQGLRGVTNRTYQEGNIQLYSTYAMFSKVLFPERFEEMKPDKTAWQKMKDRLEQDRQASNVGQNFWGMLFNMQILAAKEVIIDENGMRLVMPEKTGDFKEEKPELPVRKSF